MIETRGGIHEYRYGTQYHTCYDCMKNYCDDCQDDNGDDYMRILCGSCERRYCYCLHLHCSREGQCADRLLFLVLCGLR
jgi:hypothetical protein